MSAAAAAAAASQLLVRVDAQGGSGGRREALFALERLNTQDVNGRMNIGSCVILEFYQSLPGLKL